MKSILACFLLFAPSASLALAAAIQLTSGSIATQLQIEDSAFGADTTVLVNLNLTGTNFNLSWGVNTQGTSVGLITDPISCTPAGSSSTCTWNLSKTGDLATFPTGTGSFTYNGTTYSSGQGDFLGINLTVTSTQFTVPNVPVTSGIGGNMSSFTGVPVTLSGSIFVNAPVTGTQLLDLNFAGSGSAAGGAAIFTVPPNDYNIGNVTYTLSGTPEPSSVALTATGLCGGLLWQLNRRRKSRKI